MTVALSPLTGLERATWGRLAGQARPSTASNRDVV